MNGMYKHGKKDTNQNEIAKALQGIGCSVLDMSSLGDGAPDMCVGYRGKNIFIEVKESEKAKLTKTQKPFHERWNGKIHIVWNAVQAINRVLEEVK
jgi:hypothetical protein